MTIDALAQVLALTAANGGATYNAIYGNLAGTNSYAVSIFPERSRVLPGSATLRDLVAYVNANADLLARPDVSLGTWMHEGQVWLDCVATVSDRDHAVRLGVEFDQIAVFDLLRMEEIQTGGTGAVSATLPPLADRLNALAA